MENKTEKGNAFSRFFDRILPRSEVKKTDRFLEIIAAALMALATMCSAWSAYQATTWSGVQTFRLNEANAARSLATRAWNNDTQYLSFDAMMLIEYLNAQTDGNERLAKLLLERFRPDVKKAIDAWLVTDPFNNPDAPRSPFVMEEYKSPLKQKALQYEQLTVQKINEASKANRHGDNYILLTVLFASVLFFAGISVKFQSRRVKAAMLLFGAIAFVVTAAVLATFPVAWSGVVPASVM